MIPDFLDTGYLPEGIHEATLVEVVGKLQFSDKRKKLMSGLMTLIECCISCNVNILYLDGSFVSNKLNPVDYDACYDADCVDKKDVLHRALESFLHSDSETQKRYFKGEVYYAHSFSGRGNRQTVLDYFQVCKQDYLMKKGILKIVLDKK